MEVDLIARDDLEGAYGAHSGVWGAQKPTREVLDLAEVVGEGWRPGGLQ